MLSLLNQYQLLRDEFFQLFSQRKIAKEKLQDIILMEREFAKRWRLKTTLSFESYLSSKNEWMNEVTSFGINSPLATKKIDLSDLISKIVVEIKPFRD